MSNWKFSWGPFYNEGSVPVFDPPHGDYYSKPSQPQYDLQYTNWSSRQYETPCDGMTGSEWLASGSQSAAWVADRIEQDRNDTKRRIALQRQAYQEPTARRYYFWLGRNAENF